MYETKQNKTKQNKIVSGKFGGVIYAASEEDIISIQDSNMSDNIGDVGGFLYASKGRVNISYSNVFSSGASHGEDSCI